jgi:transcriptional regulator GlxA family with amidase domain
VSTVRRRRDRLKRRCKAATGYTAVDCLKTLRTEEAKQRLESSSLPVEEGGAAVGPGILPIAVQRTPE